MARVIIGIIILLFHFYGTGQSKKITVKSENGDPLIGVNVMNNQSGYMTDIDGNFDLPTDKFPINLVLTYVGYKTLIVEIPNLSQVPSEIFLQETINELDVVTVTGSKYEQNITKATVSVDILKVDLLRSVNATGADDILNKVPGVQILDGQANIRGGSGYSYGAGSRVMLLIDDIPALQPDAGFPNWNDIPIENLSQIEILKGPASTLYGSAALNGIINYRSSYAKSEPETQLAIGGRVFLTPKDPTKKWWGDTTRYETNLSFVHKQKFGKLDFIGSAFYNKLEGHNQFTNENRGRVYGQLRYRVTDKLSFQLGTLFNMGKNNSFFLWKNGTSGALQPFAGTVSERTVKRIYLDPSVTFFDKYDNKHKLMSRTTWINNSNDTNQSNSSTNQYIEYQYQKNFKDFDLMLTSGIVGAWSYTNSQILGDTTFKGQNHAAYIQMDKKFGDKLTIAGGLRYEFVKHQSPEIFDQDTIPNGIAQDGKMIGRLSANYQVKEYSSLRASIGQGYRYPTLTERFVTTTFGIFSIFSNPKLKPETGWTGEIGYKQGFSVGAFKGFIDLAGFISEYKDMIEFTFLGLPKIGFKPLNVGEVSISGTEIGINGQLTLGKIPFNIFGGYTYIHPIYKNFDDSNQIKTSISEHENGTNVLKYRSRHQFKMDIEATLGKFKWGISHQYSSHFVNIDRAFEAPFYVIPLPLENPDLFGIATYRDLNNKGYHLVDTRISYEKKKLKFSFLVNNILNSEYTLRPALIEAPRNVGFRIDYKIN